MRLNSRDFIVFLAKQYAELIMSKEKIIRNKFIKKRVKICVTYKCVKTTIVVKSMTHL